MGKTRKMVSIKDALSGTHPRNLRAHSTYLYLIENVYFVETSFSPPDPGLSYTAMIDMISLLENKVENATL